MSAIPERVHLVGVGGAGMSALAKILFGQGHRVSGSDHRSGAAVDMLADLGLDVWTGSLPDRMKDAGLIVASSAVPDSDSELRAAADAGIEIWRRPRLLEVMTEQMPAIGPTGTHGKTTTTALLVTGMRAAGSDPSFVAGGDLVALGTNGHLGRDDLLVLEVDEAFGTFEHINLKGLIVTNVEQDHMEHFGSAHKLEEAFVRVVRRVDGPALVCLDDPGAAAVAERTGALTYGFSPEARWRIRDWKTANGHGTFRLEGPSSEVSVALPRPGRHIASNAAGALALIAELGHDVEAAAEGLASFGGVRRRFEPRGTVAGVRIIDDYAHHPTEVSATLREATEFDAGQVWAVFQPHLYSRTRDMHRELGSALALADRVVVTDVFGSRETPIPGVTGQLVADAARRAGAQVDYVPHRGDVAHHLAAQTQPGDLVVTMGAGDIALVASELARELGALAG